MPEPFRLETTRTWRRLAPGMSLALLMLLLVGVLMLAPWSGHAEPPSEFATARGPDPKLLAFDGKRALGYLEDLCKIGPRISGTPGMKKQQELLEKHFKDLGGQVTWQRFSPKQRSTRKPVEMANLIVSWHPERHRRVIFCSHYDTRPIADQEPDPRRWREPFVSANDGGSGVALLMELGHHIKGLKTSVGVDFVFFDGEEYILDRDRDIYFLGSRHFALQYRRNLARSRTRYIAAILLDMVAGENASFPIEQNSWWRAGGLVRSVWGVANQLGYPVFRSNQFSRVPVEDDHIPLNDNGIPAIDIIDFDYPHWHRLSDTPENCSALPLEQVARVLMVWVQQVR
jgi:glutaminyl-peptide cyclotransferase